MSRLLSCNNISDFTTVRVGDSVDGQIVDALVLNGSNYIIFEGGGCLQYLSANNNSAMVAKLSQLELLRARSFDEFGNIYIDSLRSNVVAVLSRIFATSCLSEADQLSVDAELDRLSSRIDVLPRPELIIATNNDFTVYIDHDKQVKHRVRNLQLYNSDILDEFYKLRAWGAVAVHSKKTDFLNLKLATCLTVGLRSKLKGDDVDTCQIFNPVSMYIAKAANSVAAYYLVLFVAIASLVVMLGSGVIYYFYSTALTLNLNLFLIGLFGGVCGAVISVLQRAQKLQVSLYEHNGTVVLQGLVRVGLGCAFGVIALIACKAGLFLNFMNESNSRLLVLALIAGFSERLVPDFIENTSNEKSSR
ncbi:hypothetical protein [Pseudomonas shirazensis]|uniref:hypothetical protein n=1 Tax=Pseudomonas shirazensis TaxID=2745494 RepID=UPI0016440316|nr:hypothetical protein [Pseudomonas shirazensis]MBV4500770.1 hypothetical protein [Pseudomonas shirazensis]